MLVTKAVRSGTLVTLLAVSVAACSDLSTGPSGLSPDAGPLMSSGSDGSSGSSGRGQESGSRTFTIWPGAAVFEKFGDHTLYMPANVVCDPAASGYGAAHWDASCAVAQQPIQVTATWSEHNGRPVVSFSPDLRFAPSADESRWVKLWMKDVKGIDPDLYYAILWFDPELGRWVDESQADPTLQARTNQSGNLVSRRLKHFSEYAIWSGFSGYNVTAGWEGEQAADPWGTW